MLDAGKVGFTMRTVGNGDTEVRAEIVCQAMTVIDRREMAAGHLDTIRWAKQRCLSFLWKMLYGELIRPCHELGARAKQAAFAPTYHTPLDTEIPRLVDDIDAMLECPIVSDSAPSVRLNPTGRDRVHRLLACMTPAERLDVFSDYCRGCGAKDPRCQCMNDE